jgi:hypothetical protein
VEWQVTGVIHTLPFNLLSRFFSSASQAVNKQHPRHALNKCAGVRLNNAGYLTTLSASEVNKVEQKGERWKINWK